MELQAWPYTDAGLLFIPPTPPPLASTQAAVHLPFHLPSHQLCHHASILHTR